jgi:hypothetical protein
MASVQAHLEGYLSASMPQQCIGWLRVETTQSAVYKNGVQFLLAKGGLRVDSRQTTGVVHGSPISC